MRSRTTCLILLAIASSALAALAEPPPADPPDSKLNTVSGRIETTDSTWTGANYDVRHAIAAGAGQNVVVSLLTTDPANDRSPRIAISPPGDTWVVWWRDLATDRVVVRKRTHSSGIWGPERVVTDAAESGRNPEIVHDGTRPWVAYEVPVADGIDLKVSLIDDEPTPIPPASTILGKAAPGRDPDVMIHGDGGRLWVDWVQDGTFVGWSEYDAVTASWSVAAYESYAADSVSAARERVARR